jgi:histidinol-phosphate aminotransferase
MSAEHRPPAASIPAVVHGGLPLEELDRRGIDPRAVLDFSVSVHPLGPSPRVLAAAAAADLGRYPDSEVGALRRALAARHRMSADQVWAGNGASELLWLAAHLWLRPGDRALVLGPTYGEYRRAAALAGATTIEPRAEESRDFLPDLDALERLIRRERPRVAFLCNPNNPTGVYLDGAAVERLAAALGEGLLVLDEAFAGFVDDAWDATALLPRGNVLVVRSMTKDHGIPGLRLGYALGTTDRIAALRAAAPPWSVNSAAQAAGLAALEDDAHLEAGRRATREIAGYLRGALAPIGLALRPSAANFWLVRVPDATRLRAALLDEGILVRDCTSFGLPHHVRIGSRPLPDCERLVTALRHVVLCLRPDDC